MFFIYNYFLFCFSPHYIHLHTHKTAYKEKINHSTSVLSGISKPFLANAIRRFSVSAFQAFQRVYFCFKPLYYIYN